jgi:hypothetical protein
MMAKITLDEFKAACKVADEKMKADNGHSYFIMLKTRCHHCGRSPKQKGTCPRWFDTFLGHLSQELTDVHLML